LIILGIAVTGLALFYLVHFVEDRTNRQSIIGALRTVDTELGKPHLAGEVFIANFSKKKLVNLNTRPPCIGVFIGNGDTGRDRSNHSLIHYDRVVVSKEPSIGNPDIAATPSVGIGFGVTFIDIVSELIEPSLILLVEGGINTLEPEANNCGGTHGWSFSRIVESNNCIIVGNVSRYTQVFLNLVSSNANPSPLILAEIVDAGFESFARLSRLIFGGFTRISLGFLREKDGLISGVGGLLGNIGLPQAYTQSAKGSYDQEKGEGFEPAVRFDLIAFELVILALACLAGDLLLTLRLIDNDSASFKVEGTFIVILLVLGQYAIYLLSERMMAP
jgi:hypothetical protein